MAPLFHQSFDGFSNHYFVQITYHILNGQIALLGCVSLNVFSIDQFAKMPCHACNKKMASLLYGSLHDFVEMTCKNRTGKWFSSPVDIFMCRPGMIKNKLFFTVGARKGLLSCVDPVTFIQCIIFVVFFKNVFFIAPICENILSHLEQANGFPPVSFL